MERYIERELALGNTKNILKTRFMLIYAESNL